jgi:hypothetical protein
VKRLDRDVRAVQPALEQRPEVLKPVGVDLPIDVLDGVIDDAVLEFAQPSYDFSESV